MSSLPPISIVVLPLRFSASVLVLVRQSTSVLGSQTGSVFVRLTITVGSVPSACATAADKPRENPTRETVQRIREIFIRAPPRICNYCLLCTLTAVSLHFDVSQVLYYQCLVACHFRAVFSICNTLHKSGLPVSLFQSLASAIRPAPQRESRANQQPSRVP